MGFVEILWNFSLNELLFHHIYHRAAHNQPKPMEKMDMQTIRTLRFKCFQRTQRSFYFILRSSHTNALFLLFRKTNLPLGNIWCSLGNNRKGRGVYSLKPTSNVFLDSTFLKNPLTNLILDRQNLVSFPSHQSRNMVKNSVSITLHQPIDPRF